jgi:hypothetical protein
MLSPILGGIVFLLMGLLAGWIGVARVRFYRFPPRGFGVNPRIPMSPTETWLWVIAWTTMGLGFVCFGVVVLRYAKGPVFSVPASAPLIDHAMLGLTPFAIWGGLALEGVWLVVRAVREWRLRRENAGNV